MNLLYNFYFCIFLLNIQFYVCICEFNKCNSWVKSALKILTSFTSTNNILSLYNVESKVNAFVNMDEID